MANYEPLGPMATPPFAAPPQPFVAPPAAFRPSGTDTSTGNTLASMPPRQPSTPMGGVLPGALSPRGNKPKKFGVKTTEEEPSAMLKQKMTANVDSTKKTKDKRETKPHTKPAIICLGIAFFTLVISLCGAVGAGVCMSMGIQLL